eukprot:1186478-Prorocentrum_minimum.AAC.3
MGARVTRLRMPDVAFASVPPRPLPFLLPPSLYHCTTVLRATAGAGDAQAGEPEGDSGHSGAGGRTHHVLLQRVHLRVHHRGDVRGAGRAPPTRAPRGR